MIGFFLPMCSHIAGIVIRALRLVPSSDDHIATYRVSEALLATSASGLNPDPKPYRTL